MNSSKYIYDINNLETTIPLDAGKQSWIHVDTLPNDCLKYAENNFDTMFSYHPASRAKVIMYDNEVHCDRWQQSYLNTPMYTGPQKSSYMFSDKNNNICPELPPEFQVIFDYVNSLNNNKYNQVTVNWYDSENDYIPFHSDYVNGLAPDTNISVVNLVKTEDVLRTFKVKPKSSNKNALYSRVEIPLYNGLIINMCGNTQIDYTHGVPKVLNGKPGPRISLSFRSYLY